MSWHKDHRHQYIYFFFGRYVLRQQQIDENQKRKLKIEIKIKGQHRNTVKLKERYKPLRNWGLLVVRPDSILQRNSAINSKATIT